MSVCFHLFFSRRLLICLCKPKHVSRVFPSRSFFHIRSSESNWTESCRLLLLLCAAKRGDDIITDRRQFKVDNEQGKSKKQQLTIYCQGFVLFLPSNGNNRRQKRRKLQERKRPCPTLHFNCLEITETRRFFHQFKFNSLPRTTRANEREREREKHSHQCLIALDYLISVGLSPSSSLIISVASMKMITTNVPSIAAKGEKKTLLVGAATRNDWITYRQK
jgi:hypothetical protein